MLSKEFARRFIEINYGVDITVTVLSGGGKRKNELAGKRGKSNVERRWTKRRDASGCANSRQGLAERALGR